MAWLQELEHPTEAFFAAFAARAQAENGALEAARDAVERLVPLVDWAGYQPQVPHGLLGLWAVFRLQPLLQEKSFLRLLATQLHAFAHEVRQPKGRKLPTLGQGSGHWGNLRMAIETHRPSLAWGEAVGVAHPEDEDFRRIGALVFPDMACVGHKAVMAQRLGALNQQLGCAPAPGRRLLGISAWLAATEPSDTFWYQRIRRRLDGAQGESGEPPQRPEALAGMICEVGLVELLDHCAAQVRACLGPEAWLSALVLAACDKQLDARRDLEGRTAWNFAYLSAIGSPAPETWIQAAALINLFPSDEEASRLKPKAPSPPAADPSEGLREAILDGEAPEAMHHASALLERGTHPPVLEILAEAAALNDPAFNHSHHILAVASAADLLPRVPDRVGRRMLLALAKMLANSQGSCDLGRRAEREFR